MQPEHMEEVFCIENVVYGYVQKQSPVMQPEHVEEVMCAENVSYGNVTVAEMRLDQEVMGEELQGHCFAPPIPALLTTQGNVPAKRGGWVQ